MSPPQNQQKKTTPSSSSVFPPPLEIPPRGGGSPRFSAFTLQHTPASSTSTPQGQYGGAAVQPTRTSSVSPLRSPDHRPHRPYRRFGQTDFPPSQQQQQGQLQQAAALHAASSSPPRLSDVPARQGGQILKPMARGGSGPGVQQKSQASAGGPPLVAQSKASAGPPQQSNASKGAKQRKLNPNAMSFHPQRGFYSQHPYKAQQK